jgi:hypothetical protein
MPDHSGDDRDPVAPSMSEATEEVLGELVVGTDVTAVAPIPPTTGADARAAKAESSSLRPVVLINEVAPTTS